MTPLFSRIVPAEARIRLVRLMSSVNLDDHCDELMPLLQVEDEADLLLEWVSVNGLDSCEWFSTWLASLFNHPSADLHQGILIHLGRQGLDTYPEIIEAYSHHPIPSVRGMANGIRQQVEEHGNLSLSINIQSTETAGSGLKEAYEQRDYPEIMALLKRGANPDDPVRDDMSLLQLLCARAADREIFRVARPTEENHKAFQKMFQEQDRKRFTLFSLLLEKGASIERRDHIGRTPLYMAVMGNMLSYVKALLEHGADINALNHDGISPKALASIMEHEDIIRLMQDAE